MSNGCIGPINIIPDNNEVILQDVNQVITVIDNNCCTTVDITQPTTAVVQILTGPMGVFPTEGPYGFTGSFDISGSLSYLIQKLSSIFKLSFILRNLSLSLSLSITILYSGKYKPTLYLSFIS